MPERGCSFASKMLSPCIPRALKKMMLSPFLRSLRSHFELQHEVGGHFFGQPANEVVVDSRGFGAAGVAFEHKSAIHDAHALASFELPIGERISVVEHRGIGGMRPIDIGRHETLADGRVRRRLFVSSGSDPCAYRERGKNQKAFGTAHGVIQSLKFRTIFRSPFLMVTTPLFQSDWTNGLS